MPEPQNIDSTIGALYVLTHPREFNKERWMTAMLSCLTGEHGAHAKQLVIALADETGTKIPEHLL